MSQLPAPSSVLELPGPWEHRMVAANGARFHVVEAGSGPLVLLLHGFPQCWLAWRAQLPALAAGGYRAVAVDLRGYGLSDKPPRGYDPFTLSADVAGIIRSLGAADAVVVGHDWGGMLAWSTAVTQPKVVRRLCVVSAPHPLRLRAALPRQVLGGTALREVLGYQLPLLPERRLLRHGAAGVAAYLRRWGMPGWPDRADADLYRAVAAVPGAVHSALEYYRWWFRSSVRTDGMRYARAMREPVRVPVLQLHGSHDALVEPSTAAGSGRHVEAPYRWRLLDGAAHFPAEEAADAFTAELLGWLDDGEPDR